MLYKEIFFHHCQYSHILNLHRSHDGGALLQVGTTWMQPSFAQKSIVTKSFPIHETAVSVLNLPLMSTTFD
jgi:hypothetical protein